MSVAMRMHGLVLKEVKQIVRDPSAILIAFLMPVVLLIVNGFGINFDANHMKVAVVIAAPEETVRGMLQALAASPYLDPIRLPDARSAEAEVVRGNVRGMLVVREDFSQRLARSAHWPATAELAVNATDPNTARILEGYVSGALSTWLAGEAMERRLIANGDIDAAISLLVQSGATLRRCDRARDHRHGDDHDRHASDRADCRARVGARHDGEHAGLSGRHGGADLRQAGLLLHPGNGQHGDGRADGDRIVRLALPRRGYRFAGGLLALFLMFALGLGLFISTLARNQFVAAQLAFLATMLPAMMLSGMLFDIASMPQWLRIVTYAVPARYLVSILQTLFLAGDVWAVVLPNLLGLGGGRDARRRRHAAGHPAAARLRCCDASSHCWSRNWPGCGRTVRPGSSS